MKTAQGEGPGFEEIERERWSSGWTLARAYTVGANSYLFLLKSGDGTVHVRNIANDGRIDTDCIQDRWSPGWTVVEPFVTNSGTFLFRLKPASGQGSVLAIGPDGVPAPDRHAIDLPGGWRSAQFCRFAGGMRLFLLRADDGAVQARAVDDEGAIGEVLAEQHLPEGWLTARVLAHGDSVHLLALTRAGQMCVYPLGADGIFAAGVRVDAPVGADDIEHFSDDDGDHLLLVTSGGELHVHPFRVEGTIGPEQARGTSLGRATTTTFIVGGATYLLRLRPGDGALAVQRLAARAGTGDLMNGPSRTGTRGLMPGPSRAGPPDVGRIEKRWALLIGIDKYDDPGIAALSFCVHDVTALAATLRALDYSVRCMHTDLAAPEPAPRLNAIKDALAKFSGVAGPNDLIWVHFACHGKLLGDEAVLLVQDTFLAILGECCLPVRAVEQVLRASRARRVVLTLDACHSGVKMGRTAEDERFNLQAARYAKHVNQEALGFAMIAGSTAEQQAQEMGQERHGAFTYFLLKGLAGAADRTGHGYVTVDDLRGYVVDELKAWSYEHGGLIQEPTSRIEGMGDMILSDRLGGA